MASLDDQDPEILTREKGGSLAYRSASDSASDQYDTKPSTFEHIVTKWYIVGSHRLGLFTFRLFSTSRSMEYVKSISS